MSNRTTPEQAKVCLILSILQGHDGDAEEMAAELVAGTGMSVEQARAYVADRPFWLEALSKGGETSA